MESKLADPDPPVKETDPRVSQRYRSESPDPDPNITDQQSWGI
jgi:hypothetical protein